MDVGINNEGMEKKNESWAELDEWTSGLANG
jgi:hypothetical protein